MKKSGRVALAVFAGAAVWAAFWNVGFLGARALLPDLIPASGAVDHAGVLVAFVAYSVALSILAGYVTAVAAGSRPGPSVWALALLQLAIGVVVEVSSWSLTPAWYHIVFVALLVPATVKGGKMRSEMGAAGAA